MAKVSVWDAGTLEKKKLVRFLPCWMFLVSLH